jgi:carboxyl-terminal processing protease
MEPKQTGGEERFAAPVRPAQPGVAPKRRRWPRWIASLLVLVIVFGLGVNVGSGRIGLSSSRSVNGSLPATPDYTTVNQVYKSLIENYNGKLTESQLENGLKHGLAEATNDPYTDYFTPAEAKAFNQQLNNQFSGIGAELGEDSEGNLQVIAPIPNTPAAQAGLQAQDLIASINGASTSGMTPDQAVTKIRGKAGTKVTLQIIRNKTTPLTITITRQNITVPSVNTKILDGNIGYMQISTFADDTSGLAKKAADQFKQQHVKGVILDLRNNPGGLVTAAVSVSSLWLKPGQTVVTTKGTTGNQTTNATGNDELNGIPTVVLINGGSASASEITTGALHDNKDAYVIGQKSYGKGVEQTLINFGDGSQLKVTTASWYRPDGQSINHKGITPDQTVALPKSTSVTMGGANDNQLQAAESYLNK